MSAMTRLGLNCAMAVIAATTACGEPSRLDNDTSASQPPEPATEVRPPCIYRETGFRSGVNPPQEVERVEPDLSGLTPLPPDPIVIVEVRIDATGRVTEDCMLRGVAAQVDRRVLDAVRAWRFETPRLRAAVDWRGGRWEAGAAVPIFMTVVVRPGQRR